MLRRTLLIFVASDCAHANAISGNARLNRDAD